MFFITDKIITDVKVSDDHVYTGRNDEKELVRAQTSVTSLISGAKDYTNKNIRAASELSVEVHARVASILTDASQYGRKFWPERHYGANITSRVVNYLLDKVRELREQEPLVASLINHVIAILNRHFTPGHGYLKFVTERPMICEFLFHNANTTDYYSFYRLDDPSKIKGLALIGGTPDLIILEQDKDDDMHVNIKYDYVIVDFKNVTQEKFPQWQMQMFAYQKMLQEKLRQKGNPSHCRGLYIANSIDASPLFVGDVFWTQEKVLARKFRDLYLQQYNKKEWVLSEELQKEIEEAISLKGVLQYNEKRHKAMQKIVEEDLEGKIEHIKNQLAEYTKEEIALFSTNGDITLERTGKYRTAINLKEAAKLTHLRETALNGYSTKLRNEYGWITLDDVGSDAD